MTQKTEAQPEALRLAAEFEDCIRIDAIPSINDVKKSVAELRRLHAEIQQLKAEKAEMARLHFENYEFQRTKADNATATVYQFHYAMKDAGWHPGRTDDDLTEIIRAKGRELAQLSARQAAPDGWRLVPESPTEEMIKAGNAKTWVLPCNLCWSAMLSAAPPPPEREPLTELQKQALAVYLPPFQFSHGYVFDSAGRMVADEGREHELDHLASTVGVRIRGWGHLGKLKNGAAVQDAIGELAAEALNAFWKQHGIGATNG
ncbi:hypothetical protein ACQYWY_07055 [Comamonas sediminis]|uniref:hypothetical protein n=1 Tax=Comamonas sediminis TaxID=1783360 RepID=UPI003D2E1C6E